MQAPGSDECERAFMYNKKVVAPDSFPVFDKILVNGPQQSPVYTYLKSQGKFQACGGCEVAWNYEVRRRCVLDKIRAK